MFIKSLLVSSIVAKTLPPTDGKSFSVKYQSFDKGTKDHYVQASLSTQSEDFNMFLTSQNSHLAMVACKTCSVPHQLETQKMNPLKDDKLNRIHLKQIDESDIRTKVKEIVPKSLDGVNYQDSILLNNTSFDTRIFAADHTSSSYKSEHDGLIGIAPYTADDKHVGDSFLWQIKKNGIVDHMVVALTDKKVQFGSYDPESIQPGYDLDMYQTAGTNTWNLKASDFHFGKTNMPAKRLVSIEPQVEYVYAPDSDFQHFRAKVLRMKEFKPNCAWDDNVCKFDMPCEDVKAANDLDLKIRIYDAGHSLDIVIDGQDLLIPGSQFGNADDDLCYVGIYKQTHLSKQLWTIGNVILKKYLIVYDLTPFNEHHKKYIQVGIAPKNIEYDVEIVDDTPLPPVEPVKPKEVPVVVPTTPKDTTPEKPKTPETDDKQDKPKDDAKPIIDQEDKEDKVEVIPEEPQTDEEIADDRYAASPIMDLVLNIGSVIGFLVSFEFMQFFGKTILAIMPTNLFKH